MSLKSLTLIVRQTATPETTTTNSNTTNPHYLHCKTKKAPFIRGFQSF
ncbi:hypothetical protein VRK_32530 [Vibrio sp. MEBiC08052]|nr:hypothetical protein VRK_32530 [Vibrio sp. MEBiC08052]